MRRRMTSTIRASLVAIALATGAIAPANAQFFGGIVYDPTNHVQTVLTASRSLVQINNQVKSLVNEAQMIANQAKDLAILPYTARAALKSRLDEIDALVKTARGIAYDVAAADDAFKTLFPEDYAAYSNAAMAGDARRHWQEASRALRDAVSMQAKVTETVAADLGTFDEIVARSESAIGGLQVAQAQNQLLALQTKQSM